MVPTAGPWSLWRPLRQQFLGDSQSWAGSWRLWSLVAEDAALQSLVARRSQSLTLAGGPRMGCADLARSGNSGLVAKKSARGKAEVMLA